MIYKCGNEILESYQYQYDKNNNITQKTEVVNAPEKDDDKVNVTKDYTYDALGRLMKTEAADHRNQDKKQMTSYEYDKAGNRTKRISGSGETTYIYNGLDQLLSAETAGRKITYAYDENGNQVKETDTGNQKSVVNEYDADNRLSKVILVSEDKSKEKNGQIIQENLYNGNGQRVRKCEGGEKTNYFYQDGIVSYTTEDDSNQKSVQNMTGLDENVISAEQTVKGAGETGDDSHRYFLYNKDIQGSTTSILNEEGTGELSCEYGDFGETTVKGRSSLKNEICYTGGIYDAATELYYLNARYYNPEDGRFLTQDTYRGEDGSIEDWHLYAYCNNNPINYVDPSGHKYSPAKAAEYGRKWGMKRNKKYPDYRSQQADCTNFVSQCVFAGGKKMKKTKNIWVEKDRKNTTQYWYAEKYQEYHGNAGPIKYKVTTSWTLVTHFYSFWKANGATIIECKNRQELQNKAKIGDIVQFYRQKEGWYHSVIISAGRKGDYKYAAHSNPHEAASLNKFGEKQKSRIIRIK